MNIWIFINTHSGAPYEIAILILALLFISRKSFTLRSLGEGGLTNLKQIAIIIFAFLLFRLAGEFLKNGLAFPRPCWSPAHPSLIPCPDSFSLPSGHALGAFMLAVFLSLVYRNKLLTMTAFLISISISISRLMVGVHTLLDITVGSILGILFGFLLWKFYWKKPITN